MPSPLHPARLIAFKTFDKVVNPSSLKSDLAKCAT